MQDRSHRRTSPCHTVWCMQMWADPGRCMPDAWMPPAGEAEAAGSEAPAGVEQMRKAVRFEGLVVELRQLPTSPEDHLQARFQALS